MKIWINGAMGKMGAELISYLKDNETIKITGVVSPSHSGQEVTAQNAMLTIAKDLESLSSGADFPDVIVDFSIAQAGYDAAIFSAKNNICFVSGTTGFSEKQTQEIQTAFDNSSAQAIIAPNFSVGVVLMMEFSAKAAPFFEDIEIVETHHKTKKDAPSGTAKKTAQMIIDKRASEGIKTNDIPMHSLRLSGAIAHQQVHLSSQGEVLRIEHDANNRSCFMPGVVLSIEKVIEQNHVLYSIAPLLFDTKD